MDRNSFRTIEIKSITSLSQKTEERTENGIATLRITVDGHRVRVIGSDDDECVFSARHPESFTDGKIELKSLFQRCFCTTVVMCLIDPTPLYFQWKNVL